MTTSTKAAAKKGATKSPAKPASDKPEKCKSLAVSVTIADPKRDIDFGITRSCNADNTPFWTIDFVLKIKKGTEIKRRIEVHVVINKDKDKEKADALAAEIKQNKKLDDERFDQLQSEVAERAALLTPKQAESDPVLKANLLALL
jgi:hypothetical protein